MCPMVVVPSIHRCPELLRKSLAGGPQGCSQDAMHPILPPLYARVLQVGSELLQETALSSQWMLDLYCFFSRQHLPLHLSSVTREGLGTPAGSQGIPSQALEWGPWGF